MREKRKKGNMEKKKTEIKCRNGPIYETRKEGYLLIDPFEVTVPLARNFPWHASDALSIRASVLKLCTRQLRVRKNLHMHVAGASIASQFLLFEVCT